MAYKPKYARNEGQRAAPAPQTPPRKQSRGTLILFIILGIVVVPLSVMATGTLLGMMLETVGRPKAAAMEVVMERPVAADLDAYIARQMEDARAFLLTGVRPQLPEAPEETQEEAAPVRKVYWIEEGTQVAPEPDQSLFGQSADAQVLEGVLEEAKWLLEGQEMYFDPHGTRYGEGIVNYYLDDSILAVTWQEVHDGSVYTFSEIKVSHPSQFRRHLAGGEYGSDM